MIDVAGSLASLSRKRPVFHSEADFQHAFAWELHGSHPDCEIRLERRVKVAGVEICLDLLVEGDGRSVALELKYKTRPALIRWSDEEYLLRSHPRDTGRHDFLKDLARLEAFVATNAKRRGYAIMLSNDSGYWQTSTDSTTIDADFRIHEGRVIGGDMKWSAQAGAGSIGKRDRVLHLSQAYPLRWVDYSRIADASSHLRYLAVPVLPGGRAL